MQEDSRQGDPDLEPLEAIYDALDAGEAEQALRLALRELQLAGGNDPVVQFLAGVASLDLDRREEARDHLTRACELDPDDAEFRARLAEALFGCLRFEQAEQEARRAIGSDPRLPTGHWVLGLALERTASLAEADKAFAAADRLAPDGEFRQVSMSRPEFERHLRAAIDDLPEPFRQHLDNVVITIEDLPAVEILTAERPSLDPQLLGLFVGTPLTERSVFSSGAELPPRILLFKRNLERSVVDTEELREEIAVTLRHELAHYLGLDEDEIEAAGHG